MKYAMIGLILLLSGCSMSIEEYQSRVKYCESHGAAVKTYGGITVDSVGTVRCVKEGKEFYSKTMEEN